MNISIKEKQNELESIGNKSDKMEGRISDMRHRNLEITQGKKGET